MKNKTEVAHLLTSFVAIVYKQFDYHIKQIRSDNGIEFSAQKLQHFCQGKWDYSTILMRLYPSTKWSSRAQTSSIRSRTSFKISRRIAYKVLG